MLPPNDHPVLAHPARARSPGWTGTHTPSHVPRTTSTLPTRSCSSCLAGLLTLIVQLHEANIATRRDVYSRSVDAALLLHQLEFDHPDLICALEPNGPEHLLQQGELEEVRYLEMNLHLHERVWQQHQDGIFDEAEWDPWERRFRDAVVTAEMFPAVWTSERDYYQEDFARYVDAIVADELAHRAAATVAAGGAPVVPLTLAEYADAHPVVAPAC